MSLSFNQASSEQDPTLSLPPSTSKDTRLVRERLLALAIEDFRDRCDNDDDNFSGEEIGSGDDSGGK